LGNGFGNRLPNGTLWLAECFLSFITKGTVGGVGKSASSVAGQNGRVQPNPMDAAAWEEVKRRGEAAVKAWIDRELSGIRVTVVLIGKENGRSAIREI